MPNASSNWVSDCGTFLTLVAAYYILWCFLQHYDFFVYYFVLQAIVIVVTVAFVQVC